MEHGLTGRGKIVLHNIKTACASCLYHCFSKPLHSGQQNKAEICGHLEHGGIVGLGNDESMPLVEWAYIQKGKEMLIRKKLDIWNFST